MTQSSSACFLCELVLNSLFSVLADICTLTFCFERLVVNDTDENIFKMCISGLLNLV